MPAPNAQTWRRLAATCLIVALATLAWITPAHAGVANAPGANLQVSLVTYGPGETYWERFGHDAIELRDTVSGEAVNFNYGVFDFDEKRLPAELRPRPHALPDGCRADQRSTSSYYREAGRSITRQTLALDPSQAQALRDFLLWNLRPENAGYNYDYYADNCTTRVRDALDHALGGVLKAQLSGRPGGMTYRQQTDRLMSAQPWLMLIMDLGLGPYADQPLDAWHEAFLPAVLERELRHVRIADARGHSQPLVSSEELVAPNRLVPPPPTAPDLRAPLAIAGLLLAFALLLGRRYWPLGFTVLGTLYLLAAGIVGLLLLALWTLTTHHSAWSNANLLLFNPLAFALLPTLWRARHGLAASRFASAILLLQLLAALAAIALHLLPGTVQQNQPWLLFALPTWLALAWSLRQPPAAINRTCRSELARDALVRALSRHPSRASSLLQRQPGKTSRIALLRHAGHDVWMPSNLPLPAQPADVTGPVVNCVAYRRDGCRMGDITLDAISDVLEQPDTFVWVGLHEPDESLLLKLQEEFDLHDLAIEDAHNAHQRTKIETYGDSLFLVVQTAQLIDGNLAFGETQIFLGARYLVTVRHGASLSYTPARRRCEQSPKMMSSGPSYGLYGVLDYIVDNLMPIVRDFREELHKLETRDLRRDLPPQHRAPLVRHAARPDDLASRRGAAAGHHQPAGAAAPELIPDELRPYFRDVNDHVFRANESISAMREMLGAAINVNLSLVTFGQNEVMKKLAGWAAMLAAPTLLTSWYGMNFTHMPELEPAVGVPGW